ncbi:hypothetical protein [Shewanella youngdeokensis]|uniref:Uncharacterized protein n=1 Tax=Shewanella youngdeokensis TaxID=2999068 RepID=A0ABZ0JXZ4_9GAMM|nr:hypothetical protein RGE70_17625 [Shewanella sp. DAU334]
MKGLLKKTATLRAAAFFGAATTAAGAVSLTSQPVELAFNAACDSKYNSSLPASHPQNRCASPSHDLSWTSWLSGKSPTSQLHFTELFELLYGHKSAPNNHSPMKGE